MKPFNHTNATSLAEIKTALADARPLQAAKFKVQIAKVMVKRALLATV